MQLAALGRQTGHNNAYRETADRGGQRRQRDDSAAVPGAEAARGLADGGARRSHSVEPLKTIGAFDFGGSHVKAMSVEI